MEAWDQLVRDLIILKDERKVRNELVGGIEKEQQMREREEVKEKQEKIENTVDHPVKINFCLLTHPLTTNLYQ